MSSPRVALLPITPLVILESGRLNLTSGAVALLFGVVTILLLIAAGLWKKTGNIPAGPRGLPLLGCFMSLAKYPELSLDRWTKTFGPIFTFTIGRQLFLVLSDPHMVKDILVTNGAIFSSRKDTFIKAQTILMHRGITSTPYNATWILNKLVVPQAVATYSGWLEAETQEMLRDMMRDGEAGRNGIAPSRYASRVSLNTMFRLVYGTRTASLDDPAVTEVLRMSREFMNVTGAVSNLVDFFPVLQKFPNAMTTRARNLHRDLLAFNRPYIADVQARLARGEDVPDCLARTVLFTREEEELDDLDIELLCGTMLIGGVETTASVQHWFMAQIAGRPDIQAKAQAELDRVCGHDRLPRVDDEQQLQYIRAIAKEVARVHNPFWIGTPHCSTEDFAYRGYDIPKGTVVIMNSWTMHHDPVRYPDPDTFKPERYLGDGLSFADSARLADPTQRDQWAFGAGRRMCPGMLLAERQILLGMAQMLWAFRIEPVAGDPIDLRAYDGAAGRSPGPFRVRMVPRDVHVARVLGI